MHGELWDTMGSSATAEIDVLAWNDDVNSVELYLPDVTGVNFVPFTPDAGNHWMMDLFNDAGAPAGEYVGYIKATTLGSGTSALYDEVIVNITEEPVPEYVGSGSCSMCHSGKYAEWSEMGHAYKLQKMDGVNPPSLPFTTIASEPPGYTWAEIPYFLGGFAWKANFLDSNGFMGTGDYAHYYVDSGEWHEYDPDDPPGTAPYTCARCHTTGYVATGEDGPHQDGLPGIFATWAEEGIACERCHGPGGDHVVGPSSDNIEINSTSDLCGDCHSSGALDTIRTEGSGMVRDHVQRNELFNSPHEGIMTCNTCHDVHASTYYDDIAAGDGITKDCTTCHPGANYPVSGPMGALECTDCHMPKAAVSAHTTGEGLHMEGDVHSHILRIDTTGVPLEDYYEEVGGRQVIKRIDGEMRLNLAWACMQCHDGTEASLIESYALSAARADGIHSPGAEATYEGSDVCGACHTTKHEQWTQMGHAYKIQKMDGVNPPSLPFTTIASEPPGYTWAEIPYFLGGFAWKANFLDSNGYMGTGDYAHYYVDSGEWHEYDPEDPPGTSPYTCTGCHTTGYVATGEGGPHQDGLPGIYGTWAEEGIACERCHGPGSNHVDEPNPTTIDIDSSSDLCGACHSSGALETIRVVASGLVRDHVQRNELYNSPHSFFTCNTCHDSHASTYYDDIAPGEGVTAACTDCHSAANHQVAGSMAVLDCTDCHMPLAAVSAHETGEGVHMKGDVHSHIFRIDASGVPLEEYYEVVDGRTVIKDIDGEKRLNIAWACMICHDGNDAFEITSYTMCSIFATGIHEP